MAGGFLKSRLFNTWVLVLIFCLMWAELGRLRESIQRPVLDGLSFGAARWWDLPDGLHIAVLLFLAAAFFLFGRYALGGLNLPDNRSERVLSGVVAVFGLYLCINQFSELNNVVSNNTDFVTIRAGAGALFAGHDPYVATGNGYFYPPVLAFFWGPLTLLPAPGASTLFFSFKFVMMAWTLWACDRMVIGNRFGGRRRALFVLGLIFVGARFWMADLQYGNTNVVVLFLVTAAIYFDREDRPLVAGLALALAVSIKIIPAALCLHFLILGRWRTLLFFGVAMVGIIVLPWMVLQGHWWDTWASYVDVGVTGKLNDRLAQPDNQSLWGMINRMFPEVPLASLRGVWAAIAVIIASFAGYVSYRSRGHGTLVQVAAASLYPLLGLLVSPGSWVVHYTAVLVPMAVLWSVALAGLAPGRLIWPLFFLVNLSFTVSGWSRPTVKASINQSWFVVAALLLMIGIGCWVTKAMTARNTTPSCGMENTRSRG